MKTYFIKTFGCQMNYSDSERIASILEKFGMTSTENIQKADLAIFNTCGVRQMAEDRVYGQIHNLKVKSKNSTVKIIVTGCLSERKDVQKRLSAKVDLFFPIKNLERLGNWIIENISNNQKEQTRPSNQENIAYLSTQPKYQNSYQAYVPIMTGCNNFCSYCVVPYARGREISRPAKEIIKEIESLLEKDYQEIILLGQNVNSYQDGKTTFPTLLKKINSLSGKFWISFVSSHPKDMTDDLIEAATKLSKVCEYIHLPIQAGADEVLRHMNRKYTAKHYLKLIKKIKAGFKKNKPSKLFSITTDIIVGFPGETKEQFLETAKIMTQVKYDLAFFGRYSPRPGTAAWKLKDNVPKPEKAHRETALNDILAKTALENNQKYLEKTMEVLIDSQKGTEYFGHTRTTKNVKIVSQQKLLIGRFVKATIIKATPWNLEAKLS